MLRAEPLTFTKQRYPCIIQAAEHWPPPMIEKLTSTNKPYESIFSLTLGSEKHKLRFPPGIQSTYTVITFVRLSEMKGANMDPN